MKLILTLLILVSTTLSRAQIIENFGDGDFTNNPVWTGSDFTIIDNKLRSNSSVANTNFYLSTASSLANNAQWEFWVNLQFNTSGSNYIDIYVISDNADLKSSLVNGYFIRIGNTEDEISLYKRTGASGSSVKIIDGVNGSVATTNNTIKVKLKRNNTGNFTLEREIVSPGSSYFTEGNITDLSHTTSSHFGILIQQSTSSFFQKHFFDDIRASPIVTDISPPTVISATNLDSNTVEIIFNEPIDSTSAKVASNYLLSNDGGTVVRVQTTNDPAKFNLRLANALKSGTYVVSVTNIKDRNGNLIGANNNGSFSYVKPFVAQFGDVVINEIFADPSPQIDLPSAEFTELRNNTNQSISLKNWKFIDAGSSSSFGEIKIDPHSFLIICAKADTNEYKSFGKVLGLSPWPSLNNSGETLKLLSPENLAIDSVKYSDAWYRNSTKKLGGWTLERKDPKSKCIEFLNWFAAVDSSGGTPGRENSVYVAGYDTMPLSPDSLKQLSDTSITIYFNKHLNSSTLISENFVINPGTSLIQKITADSDFKKVVITYDRKFESGKDYQLKLNNLKDCSGTLITDSPDKLKFRTNVPPAVIEITDTAKLVITEIFADPSPEVNLPLIEFVELYNPSNEIIDLDKWTLNDPTTRAIIRGKKISPKEYIILCPVADTIQYKLYGKTIGLNPWPSLNNSSDQITLKSFKNRLVDSISYADAWYKSSSKKLGGWSLEKIDLNSACENYFNWTASIDTNGGTPGKQNSVHLTGYDLVNLRTDSIKLTSDTTLKVFFNKHLNNATLIAENFKLFPENSVKRITADPESREVSLTYDKKFQPGTDYQMTVAGIKDCSGNSIFSNTGLLTFITQKSPQPIRVRPDTARLIITEIFADPSPEIHLPLAEFVEIYNPSNDTVDLDKWTLNDPLTKTVFRGQKILPREYIILCPIADTVHYRSYGRTIGLNPWPSLNNSSDQITLKSFENRIVDSVSYADAWYKNSSKKGGGWSIEKIDLKSRCENFFNWTASIDTTGGTPGKQNSVHTIAYDSLILKADSLTLSSDTTIKLHFNKHVNIATLVAENFKLLPAGNSTKRITADNSAKEVVLTYDKKFSAATEYQISISNIKDCGGKFIGSNYAVKFKTSQPPPQIPERIDTAKILFTEIFADPSPDIHLPLIEFIEIYNPTNDIVDLDKWTVNDPAAKAIIRGQKILPREYIILCPIADTIHYRTYGRTIGLNPWPSLNNSSDQITLKSFKNRLVDSISYADAWYKSSSKKLGGWSLEKIDLKSACENYFNWTASIDTNGGTPGKQNSVHLTGYDFVNLRTDSIKLTSDTTLRVYFNKHLNNATLIAENFKLFPENSVKRITADPELREVSLTYDKKFQPGTDYQMTVAGIKDCSGNSISKTGLLTFKTKQPPQPVVERPDTARLVITEIFADPSPEIHLPLAEFIEIYNPTNDIVDLDKWTLNDPTAKAIIRGQKILPREYIILCPIADTVHYKAYGKTIGLSPWPSLNNAADQVVLKSFKNRLIDSLAYSDTLYQNYSKKAGGWSLEKIDLSSKCDDFLNWTASIDTNGGTPGKRNSVHVTGNDVLEFKADSLRMTSDTTVSLYFNKPLNSALLTAEAFDLLPSNLIKKISSDSRSRVVVLTFGKKFQSGTQYLLSVSKIKDCSGKLIAGNSTLRFSTSLSPTPVIERPDTAKILITEIFADPSPEVGLPLAEFVEIHNPGAETVDLNKWIIGDPTTKGIITNVSLAPGAFMILCPVADTLAFKQFGKTKGISPWPSLGNNSDQIALRSSKQRLVDSVIYSEQWYKNRTKKNGGWSLEKVDLLNSSCNGFYNWFSSIDELGGTPGRPNSVSNQSWTSNPIQIDSIKPSTDSTVVVHLSAIPDTNYLKHSQFTIDHTIGGATKISVDDNYLKIHLNFGAKFQEGVDYMLTVDSLFSCSGKKAMNTRATFTIPIIPEIDYPIVINEILPDPSPQIGLPEIEFVELYNSSEKTVSLKGLSYGDEKFQHKFTSGEIAPKSYLILCPQKDTVDFSPFGKVLGLPVWPALANDKDVLILKNNKGRELQKVSYNTTWYKNSDKKGGGYSLEMISAVSICKDFQNWAASNDLTGGTPGRENSIHKSGPAEGLKLLESVLVDSVSLLLTFNKVVDSLSASVPGNYQLNNGVGKPESATLLLPMFEKVILKFRQPLKRGHTYRVEVTDLKDCSGSNVLKGFNSTEFILTERIVQNSILINEILFNPNPGGVDFVEIYNNTKQTLDLQDLSIAMVVKDTISNVKRLSTKQLLFDPGHYISVTTDPEVIKKEYKIENPDKLLKAPLPPLGNDKGTVALLSNGGRVDQIDYNEKMHFQLLKRFEGVSLERSSFELNSNAEGNFRSATAAAGFATPGYKNSQFNSISLVNQEFALTSRTFSPDNDGFEDLLQVTYKLPAPGMVANIKIFNDKGGLIRNLHRNYTLNSTGLIVWDGLDEFNSPVGIGIYFIHAEIFDTNGYLKKFRRSFVLAAKL